MRIAMLMTIAHPGARDAAQQIAALGHEVHVVDFSEDVASYFTVSDTFQTSSIELLRRSVAGVHSLRSSGPGGARYVLAAPKLRRLLRRISPDALLCFYGGGFALSAYLSGFRPYAVYTIGSDVLLMDTPARRRLSRLALERASVVFANGDHLALKTRELAPGAHVIPLYFGLDLSSFPAPRSPSDEAPRVICTRGFLPVYNNAYLVEGLAEMDGSGSDFTATFVAPGPLLAEVRAMADEILSPTMRERVSFLGGISRSEVLELLRSSHVYVSLSHSDGTSASLLEALAFGLFPVLSDIPQNREWVNESSGNGILVPFSRPDVLSGALLRAVTDGQARARASELNQDLVRSRADATTNMGRLVDEIERVSRRRSRVRHAAH